MAKSKKQEGSKWPWIVGLGVVSGGGLLMLLTRRPKMPKDYEVAEGVVDMVIPTEEGMDQEAVNRSRMDPNRANSAEISEQDENLARESGGSKGVMAVFAMQLQPKPPVEILSVARLIPRRKSPLRIPETRGGRVYYTDVGWLGPVMVLATAVQGAYVQRLIARGHPTGWDSWTDNKKTRYVRKCVSFPPPMDHDHQMRCPLRGKGRGAGSVQLLPTKEVFFTYHGTQVRQYRPRWGDRVTDHFGQYAVQMGTVGASDSWGGWGFSANSAEILKTMNINSNYHNTRFSTTKSANSYVDWDVLYYYWRARWLVWAAEMYREHYDWDGNGKRNNWRVSRSGTPSKWRNYCRRWGIGIPDEWRVNNKHMFNIFANGVHPDVVMERMIEQVPPPGAIPAGTELGHGRLADWPQDYKKRYPLTQMGPQYMFFENMTKWLAYCDAKQRGSHWSSAFERVYVRVLGAAMAAVLTYATSGAASALAPAAATTVGGAAGSVLGVTMKAILSNMAQLMEGYMLTGSLTFNWRDLLRGLIGELSPSDVGLGSFDAVVAQYESFRNTIDGSWGYGNDLMTAIEAEYLGFSLSGFVSDYT